MKRPSLLPISDPEVKRVFTMLFNEIESLSARLDRIVNEQGQFVANLPEDVKMSTSAGDKLLVNVATVTDHVGGEDVAAGGLASLDSVDFSTAEVTNKNTAELTETGNMLFAGSSGAATLDTLKEGTTYSRIDADYVDTGTRAPKTLRRTSSDLSANDIAKQAEVRSHIGGLNNADVRDSADNLIIDVSAAEMRNIQLMNSTTIGATSALSANSIRAGATRALQSIGASGDLYAIIKEGVTVFENAASTQFGIDLPGGDNTQLEADSGVSYDDDSGDGAGGSRSEA